MRLSIPSAGISEEIPFWVSVDTFIDEELDVSPITIENTLISSPFTRFAVAVLEPDGEPPSYWMIGSDTVSTGVNGLSQHVVQLIEPTKWLERFMVGNKAVTQPLFVDYFPGRKVEGEGVEGSFSLNLLDLYWYTSPWETGTTIPIYPLACFEQADKAINDSSGFLGTSISLACKVISPSGSVQEFEKTYTKSYSEDVPNDWKSTAIDTRATLDESGVYTVEYTLDFAPGNIHGTKNRCAYKIASVSKTAGKERSLKDAALSMIWAAESLNESETPTFKLNPELASYLDTITAPEITVTSANLREALDECAKYVDSITRLDVVPTDAGFEYVVDFEKYCKDTEADLSQLGNPVNTVTRSVSCEDYCTALDATADNVVQYEKSGSLSDPSPQFYRTPRSEDATYRVTENNALIMTAFPIERLDELMCRFYHEGKTYILSLTRYVFESTEYGALSSYETTYPFSKAYALSYTLGQKNIAGLNFTVPNPVHPIFSKPAIVNIINREIVIVYGEDAPQFNNFEALDFTKLMFIVTYVPTGTVRVRMRKPNSFGCPESVLAYNQSAAKLDATAFGRSMFGAAMRMGNVITTLQYAAPISAHVPSKGEMVGEDGYISEVRVSYGADHKKVTIEVSDGFNRISQFVGVNKSQRMFEISERMSLDRHIVYEDFCLVGTRSRLGKGSLVTKEFLDYFESSFDLPSKPIGPYISGRGFDDAGNPLVAFMIPAISYGLGNAITFTGSFDDNYGAGRRIDGDKRSVKEQVEEEEKTESGFYVTETDVRYTDLFGRIEKMEFAVSDGISFLDTQQMTEGKYLSIANTFPQQHEDIKAIQIYLAKTSGDKRLLIDKDSRECIKTLTYQISFLEADDIKISSSFAESTPFAGKIQRIRFAPIDHKISNITEYAYVNDEDIVEAESYSDLEASAVLARFIVPRRAVAWAAIDYDPDRKDGKHRFLFGKNGDIEAGKLVEVSFTFFRKEIKEKTN